MNDNNLLWNNVEEWTPLLKVKCLFKVGGCPENEGRPLNNWDFHNLLILIQETFCRRVLFMYSLDIMLPIT